MFNKQNFCHVASNNRNEQKAGIFVYRTTDNLQTVTTSGYFNEKLVDINLHDLIIHEQTDNADKTKVVYNILCVTERTLDNIGTQTIFTDWEKALVVPTKLSDLTGDVSIVNPTNGQQLVYNSTTQKWENAAGGSGLPDQTGNNGKFLTTDGTDASWGDTVNAPISVNNTNNNGRSLRFVNYVNGNTTIMGMDYYYSGYSQGFVRFDSHAEALILRGKSGGSGDGQLYISGYGGWFNTPSYRYWGDVSYPWSIIYVEKLNNGADINIPNQAGTMVVADPTGATQGQVLTLDSNLTPAWADASSGSNYHPDLFDWKWADHQLDDVQWLRADTFSWQSGSVYESAYQHLIDDYDNAPNQLWTITLGSLGNYGTFVRDSAQDHPGYTAPYTYTNIDPNATPVHVYAVVENPTTSDFLHSAYGSSYTNLGQPTTAGYVPQPQTETIAGTTITYYQATDGHKIVLADQETNANAIYTATGVAWYYILDTTNERFKLPREKPLNGAIAGNGIALGITDGTTNYGGRVYSTALRANESSYGATLPSNDNTGNYIADEHRWGITTDSSKSGISAERDNTDQCKYLYFYVGEFTQTAIENTAGLNAELFNDKADKDFGNTTMIDYVVAYQNPTADNSYTWYRKYKSGWVEQGGKASTMNTTIYLPVVMADTNYVVTCGFTIANNGAQGVTKYTDRFATSSNTNTSYTSGGWIVMGMAAS